MTFDDHPAEDRFAPVTLDRRTFLLGAGALVLGACTGSDSPGTSGSTTELQALFSSNRAVAAGRRERLPIGLLSNGTTSVSGPPELTFEIRDGSGATIETVTVAAYGDAPRLYYPVRTTLPEPGIFELVTDIDGTEIVQFVQAFDRSEVLGLGAGDSLPAIASPTPSNTLGVERICTRFEGCGFHETDLATVVGSGQKLAVLVATPAFCQTFWCGPILEDLIDAVPDHPDVLPIHVEVYANTDTVNGNIADPAIELAPTVLDLGLDFEPSLYLVDGDGSIIDRYDHTLAAGELAEALARLSAA